MMQWIEGIAFVCGLALAGLLVIYPRFGPGSRHLLYLILPGSLSAATGAFGTGIFGLSQEDCSRLSLSLIILAAAGGLIAARAIHRQTKWDYAALAAALSVLLVALLYVIAPPYVEGLEVPEGYVALGFIGYISALFLLVISVIVLAGLEQILRSATETVRWELKFLLLGIGAMYAAIIYLSSNVLLFPPRSGLLLSGSIGLFHSIFLISCGLIAVSWRRGSGQARIAVSHGFIYSSITLLGVGVYLIASSLIARWASQWGDIGLPLEALIFLVSAVVLAVFILGTGFRHRTRAWIRRNIFAGRYDYRRFWMEATERIRSIDPPEEIAEALADIVGKALGSIDISVWIRRWNPNRLQLLKLSGAIAGSAGEEIEGVVEQIIRTPEPLSPEDLNSMAGEESAAKKLMERTRASILVPLASSDRIVGIITVGSDRSGRPYDREAREFLRVLGGHAASELHKSELLETLVAAKEDEAFRAFSTFVLHDLKNFSSTLSMIAKNAAKHRHNPDFQEDAFHSVFDTAEKMKRLCNSLRTFSSTLAANKKPADLNQLIRTAADNLNAGVQDRVKLDLRELPPVMIDSEEFERVLVNILLNAREAISEDGTIIVRSASLDDNVEISVEDDGKGMSREFIEKELYQPFHTTKSEGLGIGLFHSKKIMEAHRGSILVESEEGKGTKVKLKLPVADRAR